MVVAMGTYGRTAIVEPVNMRYVHIVMPYGGESSKLGTMDKASRLTKNADFNHQSPVQGRMIQSSTDCERRIMLQEEIWSIDRKGLGLEKLYH